MTRITAPAPFADISGAAGERQARGRQAESGLLAALIASTAGGDRRAFKALYDATAPKLFGIVLRIVRDRALAEDVLQDVFLRVWRNAGSYAPNAGQPLTWLASIARYRAIDVVRQRRETPIGGGENGEDWIAGIMDPHDGEAELIDREPDPSHAVIGLRNHGITATGDSLTEILDRITPTLQRQVPMS